MTTTANHLRHLASRLRTTSMPLADIIPALQRAADELDSQHAASAEQRAQIFDDNNEIIGLRETVVRYKTAVAAANTEAAIRDQLIAIGWTPPPSVAGVVLAQRREAIDHLQAILNSQRTATQAREAEQAAREWLHSIGSEPR